MRILLIPILLALGVVGASANDTGTLAEAGILNTTWAMDCSKPPSPENYYLIYGSKGDGGGTETQRTNGDDVRDLRNVQVISDKWLVYTYIGPGKNEYAILTKRDGDRKKSWWSVATGNRPLIMNGKFVSSGAEVPWFEKCK